MPIHFEIRTISGVLNRGEMVLQQLAHFKHDIFENASSCRSGRCFSRPRMRLVRSRNCLFSFFFFSASCCQVCSLNCMVQRKEKTAAPSVPEGETKTEYSRRHSIRLFPSLLVIQHSIFNILHFVWYALHKGYICRSNNLIR